METFSGVEFETIRGMVATPNPCQRCGDGKMRLQTELEEVQDKTVALFKCDKCGRIFTIKHGAGN